MISQVVGIDHVADDFVRRRYRAAASFVEVEKYAQMGSLAKCLLGGHFDNETPIGFHPVVHFPQLVKRATVELLDHGVRIRVPRGHEDPVILPRIVLTQIGRYPFSKARWKCEHVLRCAGLGILEGHRLPGAPGGHQFPLPGVRPSGYSPGVIVALHRDVILRTELQTGDRMGGLPTVGQVHKLDRPPPIPIASHRIPVGLFGNPTNAAVSGPSSAGSNATSASAASNSRKYDGSSPNLRDARSPVPGNLRPGARRGSPPRNHTRHPASVP